MAITFRAPQAIVEQVFARLKCGGLVHPDAFFNTAAEGGLRREVAYRDFDFMDRLDSPKYEEAVVDEAVAFLKQRGLIACDASYIPQAYEQYRKQIADTFTNPFSPKSGTSVGGTMQRLLYAMTSVRQPAHLIELGSFWGNTLAWFAGPCVGSHPCYRARRIIGIDMDVKMTDIARANFAKLPNAETVELIGEDARTALDRLSGPFDALYLEAKSAKLETFYLVLLQQIYDRLPKGAWVLAHDVLHCQVKANLSDYLAFVRDKAHFAESICFDVDWCGLELSIR